MRICWDEESFDIVQGGAVVLCKSGHISLFIFSSHSPGK